MANASCSNCTLVSNLLTLVGAVSGTVLVGMTITGAGVPAGVTVTSYGTGTGQAGTYNCSASAANVTIGEAMVLSLSWDMPLQGNSGIPQLVDLGRAAGFGFIVASAFGSGTAGMGQEYQFGLHAAALYNQQSQSSTQVFRAAASRQGGSVVRTVLTAPQYVDPPQPSIQKAQTVTGEVKNLPIAFTYATPQVYDPTPTLQATLDFTGSSQSSLGFGAEYQFGTHQKALYDSQNSTVVWNSLRAPPVQGGQVPLRSLHIQGQELTRDLTIQGWSSIPSVATGWLVTMVTAGPQLLDLTQQAWFSQARPFQSIATPGPINPTFVVGQPQFDPTQIPARVIKPPAVAAKNLNQVLIQASPSPSDQLGQQQIQPRLFATALPGPAKYVQPVLIVTLEQQYDKSWFPTQIFSPLIFIPPVISPPAQGPPDISVWTADATSITADTIAFTCDGADLINGGAVQVPGLSGRPAYTVSSQNYTQPLAGAALSNNVPLPVTSPPMVYYINGVAYLSGQPI